MTRRFKNLMSWQENPNWYNWIDGHWVLTDNAPEEARRSFELYTKELQRYRKDSEAKLLKAEQD